MNLEPSDIYVVASLLSNIDDWLSERWDLCVWIYYWCMVVEDALFCLWYFLMRYLWSLLIFGPLLSSLGHIVHFTLLLVQYNLSSLCYLVLLTYFWTTGFSLVFSPQWDLCFDLSIHPSGIWLAMLWIRLIHLSI